MKKDDVKLYKAAQKKKAAYLRKAANAAAKLGPAKKAAKRKRQDSVGAVVDISQDNHNESEDEEVHQEEKRLRKPTCPLNYGKNLGVTTPKQAKVEQAKVASKTPPSTTKKPAKKPVGSASFEKQNKVKWVPPPEKESCSSCITRRKKCVK